MSKIFIYSNWCGLYLSQRKVLMLWSFLLYSCFPYNWITLDGWMLIMHKGVHLLLLSLAKIEWFWEWLYFELGKILNILIHIMDLGLDATKGCTDLSGIWDEVVLDCMLPILPFFTICRGTTNQQSVEIS